MLAKISHDWNPDYTEAVEIQRRLAGLVRKSGLRGTPKRVAAVDVSYAKQTDMLFAVVAVFDFPKLALIEEGTCVMPSRFPYIPGLLSFREAPAVLKAFEQINTVPDVIIFDGQGIAHPRRFGIASHVGVLLDTPSIGCAKSLLTGTGKTPGVQKGASSGLYIGKEKIGLILRTRDNTSPCYVSIGHSISLTKAKAIILECCRGYRLPEVIRHVHHRSNELRLSGMATPNEGGALDARKKSPPIKLSI